eukprot:m51a1_g3055 hypothetical protein (837) ;mRNA; f:967981-971134
MNTPRSTPPVESPPVAVGSPSSSGCSSPSSTRSHRDHRDHKEKDHTCDAATKAALQRLAAAAGLADASAILDSATGLQTVDKDKMGVLHYCAAANLGSAIARFLERLPKGSCDAQDAHGRRPLHVAAAAGALDAMRALLQGGGAAGAADDAGATPLHYAVARGRHQCVSVLLLEPAGRGAAAADAKGTTLLHVAALSGDPDMVALLIRRGADVNAANADKLTPLHMAALKGDVRTIKLLLAKGASPELVDRCGGSALHRAAHAGNEGAIRVLCKARPALANLADSAGNAPVAMAVAAGRLGSVQELLRQGANPEAANRNGESSLHVGGRVGATEALTMILNHLWNLQTQYFLQADNSLPRPSPPNPNAQDSHGRTPLHLALAHRHAETAKALILKGCDPSVKDKTGKACSDVALSLGVLSAQELEQLNKQRVALARARDRDSPEYKARYKEALTRAVQLFSTKPMLGVEHMQNAGLLGVEPEDVAEFLAEPELNKTKLGELIGGHSEACKALLRAFVRRMEFTGLEFEAALRRFLQAFRLPGESQVIDRIMESFAQHYAEQNPGGIFANTDAIYILAFSVIMLNTDAHNPQVKNKMTKAQFLKTTRGINAGQDLPQQFLENLYDRIVSDEIKMDSGLLANAEKKGWLTKQGGRVKTWKRRWFVLADNCLYYFRMQQDAEPCGLIPLEGVEVASDRTNKHCFVIKRAPGAPPPSLPPGVVLPTPSQPQQSAAGTGSGTPTGADGTASEATATGSDDEEDMPVVGPAGTIVKGFHDVYYISAASKSEMESWIRAINSAIHHNPFYSLVQHKTGEGGAVQDLSDLPQISRRVNWRLETR